MRERGRRAEDAGEPKPVSPRRGSAPGGRVEVWSEEETAPPSGVWTRWDEAEEMGDRDVAALMWEAMYGRGAAG